MELYSYSMIGEDFLEHYGVKGMKWGRRKARAAGQRVARGVRKVRAAHKARQERRHPKSADAAAVLDLRTRAKKQGLDSLSNAELARLNNRLNLENNYRKAMTKHPDTLRKKQYQDIARAGFKIAKPILKTEAGELLKKSNNPRARLGGHLLTGDISGQDVYKKFRNRGQGK